MTSFSALHSDPAILREAVTWIRQSRVGQSDADKDQRASDPKRRRQPFPEEKRAEEKTGNRDVRHRSGGGRHIEAIEEPKPERKPSEVCSAGSLSIAALTSRRRPSSGRAPRSLAPAGVKGLIWTNGPSPYGDLFQEEPVDELGIGLPLRRLHHLADEEA